MEQDLAILQKINDTLKNEPEASQRQLAENASVSIGFMNAILKRFVERGWIMLTSVNGRKLAYALTSQGINELYKCGRAFTARTFSIANKYNEIIYGLVNQAKIEGKSGVVLYGNSYIKFLISYVCNQLGVELQEKNTNEEVVLDCLCFAGELSTENEIHTLVKQGCVSLIDMIQD